MSNASGADSYIESWKDKREGERKMREREREVQSRKQKASWKGRTGGIHLDLASELLVMGNATTFGPRSYYLVGCISGAGGTWRSKTSRSVWQKMETPG